MAAVDAAQAAAASNAIVAITTFYAQALGAAMAEVNRELKQADPVVIANMLAERFAESTAELKRKIAKEASNLEIVLIDVDHHVSATDRGRLDTVLNNLRELAK
jgi:DICT domain-containing protein